MTRRPTSSSSRKRIETTRLTLICHAATLAVRAADFPLDEAIEPRGQAQAEALAGELGRVDRAWTGPALRARQTAAALGLAAEIEPALRDIDLGRWAGASLAQTAGVEPEAVAAWSRDPAAAPHGGESVIDLVERVRPWLQQRAAEPGRGIAVTHASVIRAAILLAIDAHARSFWRIDVVPLCRVELRAHAGAWRLRSLEG